MHSLTDLSFCGRTNKWKLRYTYRQITIIAYFLNDPVYTLIYLRVIKVRFFFISQITLFEFSLYRNIIVFCILFQVSRLTIRRGNILRYYNNNNKKKHIRERNKNIHCYLFIETYIRNATNYLNLQLCLIFARLYFLKIRLNFTYVSNRSNLSRLVYFVFLR